MDTLWKNLLTDRVLKRGWHLARSDARQDFVEDLLSSDVYAVSLADNIRDCIERLSTETYRPRPLLRVEVPKGTLGLRPGTVPHIEDRLVLYSIVLLLAERADSELPDTVYSWRLRRPLPKKGGIFQESSAIDLPFLKHATVRAKVDPFEAWYVDWPEFDRVTRGVFTEQGYDFLATSDIAAYFENIQLPILRDRLLQLFPQDPRVINLLFEFLETWCPRTESGRHHLRGLPQGNATSSFLGNLFLLPLDKQFRDFASKHDALYFRYMDDVRIFTKREEDARRAIFLMDRCLRSLHLNVQSAKTKIFDERKGEISQELVDSRLDQLDELDERVTELEEGGCLSKEDTQKVLSTLKRIGKRAPPSAPGQKIVGAKRPLTGLSLRSFRRWMNIHQRVGSYSFVWKLIKEIQKNPDHRLTRKLVVVTRQFPSLRTVQLKLLDFIHSPLNIFPHQEAECLRAIRYLGQISDESFQHCLERAVDSCQDFYVRMEAAYLLARMPLETAHIAACLKALRAEPNAYVKAALSTVVVQRRSRNSEVVRELVLHPHEKIRSLGKLYRVIKNDHAAADARLAYLFKAQTPPWALCDNVPFLRLMELSNSTQIRQRLLDSLKVPRYKTPITGLRPLLQGIYKRCKQSLRED